VKHWVIVPFHKVDTGIGIERWKGANCRQALQGMFCVCAHTDMSMVVIEQYLAQEEQWSVKELDE